MSIAITTSAITAQRPVGSLASSLDEYGVLSMGSMDSITVLLAKTIIDKKPENSVTIRILFLGSQHIADDES